MSAISCDNVVHIYHLDDAEVVALRGVDLEIADGEAVALLGPSGSGKTTLLWLLAGLLRPSAGTLRVLDREIAGLNTRALTRLRSRQLGIVLQNPGRNVLPQASAAGNVAFARRIGRPRRSDRHGRGAPPVGELLERAGLTDVARQPAGRLSGGEQQRLGVVIALAHAPRLLLADEPTSQLDQRSAELVIDLLKWANEQLGATVVVVTHDPMVGNAFDRTFTIRDGRVGMEGRGGQEYVVVGRDGSVQLPPHVRDVLPPGSRAEVRRLPDGVELRRATE